MAPGIELHVPSDLRSLYEVYEYRHAAVLLHTEFPAHYAEICDALREFRFSRRAEFGQKIKHSALSEIKDRVKFLGYSTLVRQYEDEVYTASQEFAI